MKNLIFGLAILLSLVNSSVAQERGGRYGYAGRWNSFQNNFIPGYQYNPLNGINTFTYYGGSNFNFRNGWYSYHDGVYNNAPMINNYYYQQNNFNIYRNWK